MEILLNDKILLESKTDNASRLIRIYGKVGTVVRVFDSKWVQLKTGSVTHVVNLEEDPDFETRRLNP
jgi:hypothetical protein